ncbi:hypothetical protein BD779DRAFT_454236 [Infundibulicybe gibba]|nr:hypothetical protein BD779DRAFT_454236 [Infundibulicybe gibba]
MLDFSAINQGGKTSFNLSSPIILATNQSSKDPGRLLASPVVDEFRGWFSNLFNWKHQGHNGPGIFYSTRDVHRTRSDVGKFLESMGVVVEGKGFRPIGGCAPIDHLGTTLKCRVDEGAPGSLAHLKASRFRSSSRRARNNHLYCHRGSMAVPFQPHHATPT